jgi:hypothetical protein
LFKCLRPIVNVLHSLSTNEALRDSVSHVSPVNFLVIYLCIRTLYLPGVSARKGRFLRYRDPSICAYSLAISAPFLVKFRESGLTDGQICEGKLRRPNRYLRMYRELPQKTQDLRRYPSYSRDDGRADQNNGRITLGARPCDKTN